MSAALLPCPFCGETPTMDSIRADENQGTKWGSVVCCINGPEVRTEYGPVANWADRAIAAWNTRATPPAAAAVVEGLDLVGAAVLRQILDAAYRRQLSVHEVNQLSGLIAALPAAQKWRPIETAPIGERILTRMKHGAIEGVWDGETASGYYWRDMEWYATHWMPVPALTESPSTGTGEAT